MHEHRCMVPGSGTEGLEYFILAGGRRVLESHSFAQRPECEPRFDSPLDVGDLLVARDIAAAGANWQEESGVLHYGQADGDVTDRGAVVDECLAFAIGVESSDVASADLELERGGDAVERIEAIVLVVLPVDVEIDETWSEDEAFCVDHLLARQRARCDCGDLASANPDRPNRIELRLWVDDAAVHYHDVICSRLGARGARACLKQSDENQQWQTHVMAPREVSLQQERRGCSLRGCRAQAKGRAATDGNWPMFVIDLDGAMLARLTPS